MKPVALALCLLIAVHSPASSHTLHVPGDHATISTAIAASSNSDTILVAPGEYVVTEPLNFRGKLLHLKSESGPETTVIRMGSSQAERGSVFIFESGETEDAVLEGFTLTGGTGTRMGEWNGGAVLCLGGSCPILKSLIITLNRATYGGALYCKQSSPTLMDCTLSRNHVKCGGGVFCDGASPRLIRCLITGNQGSFASSGVHCKHGSAPELESCRILGNCTYMGGALDCFESSPRATNCVLAGNFARRGGAVFCERSAPVLKNCTIVGNAADEGGGLLCIDSSPEVVNCIIWGNLQDSVSYAATNCLSHEDPRFVQDGSFRYDRFASVVIQGQSCSLPDFVLTRPDYHLQYQSPAIDRGRPAGAPRSDIDGNQRPCGRTVDIGAYEFQSPGCLQVTGRFRRADTDGDGQVLINDAVLALLYLFRTGGELPCLDAADTDDNGRVEISDCIGILTFLYLGGPAPPEPFASCGVDSTSDELICAQSGVCQD